MVSYKPVTAALRVLEILDAAIRALVEDAEATLSWII